MKTPTLTRCVGMSLGCLLLVGVVLFGRPVSEASAEPTGIDVLRVSGRGWGHGRGMSQYGALGFASEYHWSAEEILNHFYGGTDAGLVPASSVVDPKAVRVDLTQLHGLPTTVAVGVGGLRLLDASGNVLRVVGDSAVRLQITTQGFTVQSGPSCVGPWSSPETVSGDAVRVVSEASTYPEYDGAERQELLEVCGPTTTAWYDGSVVATRHEGEQRTVNILPVEEYLRGVVPNEMVASWPEAALQAQAVAARSYLYAGDRRQEPFADTCDSARCQVYDGRFSTRKPGLAATHPRTDQAIKETTDVVRIAADGSVARTEFSASSGGRTVEGVFPAVEDHGDSIAGNPHHTWNVEVSTSELVEAYGYGPLVGASVLTRTGSGALGGRVVEVQFRFVEEVVVVDGNTARRMLGLKSDWFTFS